jgi:hypothetical protein
MSLQQNSLPSHAQIAAIAAERKITEDEVREAIRIAVATMEPNHNALHRVPVTIEEFLDNPYYTPRGPKGKSVLFPVVRDAIIELNQPGKYTEAILTGGIGSGKTTVFLHTQKYQLYLLSCYENPHAVFDLDPASEILIIFQNLNAELAKDVDYNRFKAMVDQTPYFQRMFPYDKSHESQMRFRNRIICKPVSGQETAAIGQNVIGGGIDEINYMAVVEKSKKKREGGLYDQAVELYNSIATRRESRFLELGKLPGMLCLISSRRYPGQFTDRKELEALKPGSKIFLYDKTQYDVRPDKYSGEKFPVFIGDSNRRPRILSMDDMVAEEDVRLLRFVPVELRSSFERDILQALRDIAGVSTYAISPYMFNIDALGAAFSAPHSIFSAESTDLGQSMVTFDPKKFAQPELPRWVHIDLGLSSDSAGLAIGYVPKFVQVKREGTHELLPLIRIDGILEIHPPPGGEIEFSKIRQLLYDLRAAGLNIRWVSLDSWQSVDSRQILMSKGFIAGIQSIDKTTLPYDIAKQAIYDYRVTAPKHQRCLREWAHLERDNRKKKIDHPPNGSKDCSDAMAGVVYGLTMRRELWAKHGVLSPELPPSIKALVEALKVATAGAEME